MYYAFFFKVHYVHVSRMENIKATKKCTPESTTTATNRCFCFMSTACTVTITPYFSRQAIKCYSTLKSFLYSAFNNQCYHKASLQKSRCKFRSLLNKPEGTQGQTSTLIRLDKQELFSVTSVLSVYCNKVSCHVWRCCTKTSNKPQSIGQCTNYIWYLKLIHFQSYNYICWVLQFWQHCPTVFDL